MTATDRSVRGGAASTLVAAARHPEVPEAVLVVAPGQGHRRGELKLGHFAAGRWDVAGSNRAEVLIGGEGLRLGPLEVLGTQLHEAAHGLGHARSVQSTSRGGRYHNAQFRRLAQELGLEVAQVGSIGWSDTSVPDEIAELYRPVLDAAGRGYRRRPGRQRLPQSLGLPLPLPAGPGHPRGRGNPGPRLDHVRGVRRGLPTHRATD